MGAQDTHHSTTATRFVKKIGERAELQASVTGQHFRVAWFKRYQLYFGSIQHCSEMAEGDHTAELVVYGNQAFECEIVEKVDDVELDFGWK